MSDSHDSGWFRDTPEARRLLEIERAKVEAMEAEHDDEITGYPDHYIINGDHSSCPCPIGAAARIRALIDRIPDSTHATVEKTDLRAVLAENETMRQQLAAMTIGYGLEWTNRNTGEHGTTSLTSRAKADELHAACHDFETMVVSRLVGQWQPADPSPSAPMPTCAPTPNALICACGQPVGHDKPSTEDAS